MAKAIEAQALARRRLQPHGLRLAQARRLRPRSRLYDKALELDPHHRGALEYLGEAYLELDRPDDAAALLERLATACQRVAHGGVDWQDSCEEWQDLKAAYDAYGGRVSAADARQ